MFFSFLPTFFFLAKKKVWWTVGNNLRTYLLYPDNVLDVKHILYFYYEYQKDIYCNMFNNYI